MISRGVLTVGGRVVLDGVVVRRGSRVLFTEVPMAKVKAKKTKRMPRLVYEVRSDEQGWGFFDQTGKRHAWRGTKHAAVGVATDALADAYMRCGVLSELKIKNRAGVVLDSRTYGDDPPRTRG